MLNAVVKNITLYLISSRAGILNSYKMTLKIVCPYG